MYESKYISRNANNKYNNKAQNHNCYQVFGGKHNRKKLSDDHRCGSDGISVVSTSIDSE